MSFRLSENAVFSFLINDNGSAGEPGLHDIGGTNASTDWVDMQNWDRVCAYVQLGTWNATDDLDECRLEQATSSAGAGAKDLTTDASGGNYDTSAPIDAAGNFVILEARAEQLDVTNGFRYVRLYVAEGGNTGVDNVAGVLVRYNNAYPQKEMQGAAVAGEKVYVKPTP